MTDFLPWRSLDQLVSEQVEEFRQINSGIHIALLGTTRGGKTTLATGGKREPGSGLLAHFENVLILDSTADPGTISEYGKPVQRFRSKIEGHRRLTVTDMSGKSKAKLHHYITQAVKQGNVCIYADEVRQLADRRYFGLGKLLDYVWLFGAKRGVSLVGGTQAPRFVPSSFYDQSKMHFIFGIRDRRAMKRLAEISGDVDTLEATIPTLPRFHFAYVGVDGEVRTSVYALTRNVHRIETEKRMKIVST